MQNGYLYGRNGKKIEATSTIPEAKILEFTEANEVIKIICICEIVYGESWSVESDKESKFVFVEK
jgi:hypothetical protein